MRILENFPNAIAPTPTYPYGDIRDEDTVNNIQGTPINRLTNADIHQFFNKMADEAGITRNDLPDNEDNGYQTFEALYRTTLLNEKQLHGVYSEQLSILTDSAVGQVFNLFVTTDKIYATSRNALNPRIFEYNIDGTYVTSFGGGYLELPVDIAASDTHLFITDVKISSNNLNLQIVEISSGNLVGSIVIDSSVTSSALAPIFLDRTLNKCYISQGEDANDSIFVVDVQDETNPSILTNQEISGQDVDTVSDIFVVRDRCYFSVQSGGGGVVWQDISDVNNPVNVSAFASNVSQPSGITIIGTKMYVVDSSATNVYVYDINTEGRLTFEDETLSDDATDIFIRDDRLYAASNSGKILRKRAVLNTTYI